MPHVLKAWFNFSLGFHALDVWGGIHFISACCRLWMDLQLPVSDYWRWVLIFNYVMCSRLDICNRVNHTPGMLSYKHDAVTWITVYPQVIRIVWNKRFASIIKGLKYILLQLNIIFCSSSQKYIMTAVKFSLITFCCKVCHPGCANHALWTCEKENNYVDWVYCMGLFTMHLVFVWVPVLKLDACVLT